ncbi:hypothetical protein L7F22_005296 [Adiantum nelumboides]|nr:hypothetical protein [Adiantum nelumboides]
MPPHQTLYYDLDDDGAPVSNAKGKRVIARMHELMWVYFPDDILTDWRCQPADSKNTVINQLHREFPNPEGYQFRMAAMVSLMNHVLKSRWGMAREAADKGGLKPPCLSADDWRRVLEERRTFSNWWEQQREANRVQQNTTGISRLGSGGKAHFMAKFKEIVGRKPTKKEYEEGRAKGMAELISFNASRITKRLADGCSEGPHCVFNALDYVKLQRGPYEHPSARRITICLALELVDKPYDLSASSNASRLTIRLVDGCSKGPNCVFSALQCIKVQRGFFEYPSASRITIRLALELADKSYDLPVNSNASRITKRLADGCLKGPRCVFSALGCVKLQRGPSEHISVSRITIRLALELAGKPYDLPASSNANRLTIRLADGYSEDTDSLKLQCEPSEHPSANRMAANRMVMRLAIELAGKAYDLSASSNASELADKSYDLLASSNASRITKRLADGFSKDPRCIFSALYYVKLQHGPSKHPSANRIIIRFALEFVGKPYDLTASSNANRLTIRLTDGCSEGPRCVFNVLNYVKSQRGPSKYSSASLMHPSANCITIRFALEFAGKQYDLPASCNASRLTIWLADGYSENSRCVFSALDCVKLQRGPSEHPSASRITIQLALQLTDKPYDLPRSSNASRITKRLADGCSKGSHCVLSALDCVMLQRGPFEHTSAGRISIRLGLELVGKSYDMLASSNARRLTIRLVDGCSEGPLCVFSALHCVKLQCGFFEYPSASRITIRLALKLDGKSYDLSINSNASRITKRLADGCSKGPRCIFSALGCVKLQREPSEHPSVNRITIRFALELAGKPYDLTASSNANQLTIRLADGCSEGPRCVFNALDYVKLQRGLFKYSSTSRMLASKPYNLPRSSNASRITKRLADGCSEGPHCVLSALDCVKLQRGPSEHTSASRISIRLGLELIGKPYDMLASSNASRLTIRLVDGCSKGPLCVFSALHYVKLQCGFLEYPSASRITIRLALELAGKPYDLSKNSNASRITKRLADGCSKGPRCIFSALGCVKLQREPSEHPSASRITIRLALELADKPYDLPASSNASQLTIRLADGCSEGLRCGF